VTKCRLKGDRLRLIRDTLPSMLVEMSVMQQRYQAVLAVIRDGVSIVQVAHRFGVSLQAVHRWLRWYQDQGLGLVDRSHRPPRCSHQMAPAAEVWVLEARRRNTATVPTGAATRRITVTTPVGTATSSTNFSVEGVVVPVEKYPSNVTLELSGHLVASGDVRTVRICDNGRHVNVQRYSSGHWKTIRKDRTGSTGRYRTNLPEQERKIPSAGHQEEVYE
jgi:transposase-like protein